MTAPSDPAIRSICVFCGSSPGRRPEYEQAARRLASVLVEQGITLVYGGSRSGLMGVVADEVLARGGVATGVITSALVGHEIAHEGLTELHVVDSMAERKARFAELSDAFIALPGGFGTLEELFEMVTASQLHLQDKPCAVLDVAGYYTQLRAFIEHAVAEELITPANLDLLLFEDDPLALLDRLSAWTPTTTTKWTSRA